jgi:hypothetical protein
MRLKILVGVLLMSAFAHAQTQFTQTTTDMGRIKLTLSNAGTIGRPNVRSNTQGPSSMSFPQKGNEHLFEAGIWIGAIINGQKVVSSSAADASSGYAAGAANFEFTPLSPITQRSSIQSSPNFSAAAVSHQDLVMRFTDSATVVPGTSTPISGHVLPLRAMIDLEAYSWNYSYADFFVICNYKITNTSNVRWDSVYVGQWSDLVVRNVNVTRQSGTNFFNKGRNGVDFKNNAIYAWLSDVSADDINYINSYGAMQFLGVEYRGAFLNPEQPETFTSKGWPAPKVNYNFWNFNSVNAPWIAPSNEQDRYNRMTISIDSAQMQEPTIGPSRGQPNNWIQLMSAGPMVSLEPGESFNYVVAFVCANRVEDGTPPSNNGKVSTPATRVQLESNLTRAKSTYLGEDVNGNGILDDGEDLNENGILDRYVLPEPPATPKTKVVAKDGTVEIYWDDAARLSVDPITRKMDFEGYKLYRTNPGDDLQGNLIDQRNLIAQWDSAGNNIGYNNGFDEIKLNQPYIDENNDTFYYKYTIKNMQNGWQYLFILTSFDEGDEDLGLDPLESSFVENAFSVFTGTETKAIESNKQYNIGVYPNPYYVTAAWDGSTSRSKKIYFTNLPAKCSIHIYTSSGDLVANMRHDASTYSGGDIQWFDRMAQTGQKVFSGGEHAWDILSNTKGAISTGVYLVVVKDEATGNIDIGKFAIIK